jgi:hypothetical protein
VSQELRQKLARFTFDDPTAERPFTVRLAEENGWTREFAVRAVEEYRRFLYLAVTCGHPLAPSPTVDTVWHLHLRYTRSYWDELCRGVLGRPLHHNPSPGGEAARVHGSANYLEMIASYRNAFGEPSPEIWPRPVEDKPAAPARAERVWAGGGCNCGVDDAPAPRCPYCSDAPGARCNYCRCACQ